LKFSLAESRVTIREGKGVKGEIIDSPDGTSTKYVLSSGGRGKGRWEAVGGV